MFTQKHYLAIAKVIHDRRVLLRNSLSSDQASRELETVNQMTLDLSNMFKSDNPKFDTFKFIAAANADQA